MKEGNDGDEKHAQSEGPVGKKYQHSKSFYCIVTLENKQLWKMTRKDMRTHTFRSKTTNKPFVDRVVLTELPADVSTKPETPPTVCTATTGIDVLLTASKASNVVYAL